MSIFFFDTETTGLPQKSGINFYDPAKFNFYDTSRIVQLAWIITDKNGEVISKESYIIAPLDFKVTCEDIHGIRHEKALLEGVPLHRVIDILYNKVKSCSTISAHNLSFDYNILLAECYRLNRHDIVRVIKSKEQFCTMRYGKDLLGYYKYPKLKDLYEILYKEKWIQKHEALDDTEKCVACYKKLIERLK
jgi:DNA polymerase-3 subunit alpha